jgi:hypothetical protein
MDHVNISSLASLFILGLEIPFGFFYRKVKSIEQKLRVGTIVGLLALVVFCGLSSLHLFLCFAVCCAIIKVFERSVVC